MSAPYNGAPQAHVPNPASEAIKKNALIATIVGFLCGGTVPGILGLVGYLQADTNPEGARKLVKWAWIVFGIMWVIAIILIIIYVVFIGAMVAGSTSGY